MRNLIYLLLVVVLITGCADVVQVDTCLIGEASGFWYGIWHGWIAAISFVISLFNDDVAIYAVNNTGAWYDLGFVLGVGGFTTTTSKLT